MATFQAQVESLTSLSVGTTPTTSELSQFLKDGVIDVTNKWLAIRPQDAEQFQRESSVIENNGDIDLKGAKVLSVIREAGADGSSDGSTAWEPCRKVPASMQSRVVDPDSLHFASKYNPVYTIIESNEVHVYPTPDGTNDSFKVFYVNHIPKDQTNSADLAYNHSDIKYFPSDKVYLVSLYASIKTVAAVMGGNIISISAVPPDSPALTAVSFSESNAFNITATGPGAISLTTVDYSASSATVSTALASLTAPTYTKTSLQTARVSFEDFWEAEEDSNPFGDGDPGSTIVTAVPPDTIDVPELASVGNAPDYTQPTQVFDIDVFETFLETNEDVELAQTQMARLQLELGEYQADIQNELNEFNKENVEFQATIQRAIQEDTLITQKYQTDLAVYQAEVNAQVQDYTQKLQRYQLEMSTAYQAWAKSESDSLQEYQLNIQNELNEFNKDNVSFQYEVQKALADANATNQMAIQNGVQEARDAMENNNAQVQKFQAVSQHYATQVNEGIQTYTAQLQSDVQTMQGTIAANQSLLTKYQAELSHYQAETASEIQEKTTKMQQYQLLYNQLKAEYDGAFAISAPKQQPVRA